MTKNKKDNSNNIALNKKARHDYFIEQSLEAGLSLQGWEVKSLRENKVQIKESYVILKNNELYLFGAHISPLNSVSVTLILTQQGQESCFYIDLKLID